jgi:dTDP-glucose 4,6-dehydratase
MKPLFECDLDEVLENARPIWNELRGARIFITGGTGFFGMWLLESLCFVNDKLGLNAHATVLTRDTEAFQNKTPHLAAHPALEFLEGDIRTFGFPCGRFTHVIHAATDSGKRAGLASPRETYNVIAQGTRQTLEFAAQADVRRFLLVSSGAVYGTQPTDLEQVSEEFQGAPDPLDAGSAYGQGKRLAEFECALQNFESQRIEEKMEITVARGFAFVGPHLPLDAHFAAGNFIRDGLAAKQKGGTIHVGGDGSPLRSYLYASDLAAWLWVLLVNGKSGRAYNVGSEEIVSIAELAQRTAACFQPSPVVEIACKALPGAQPSRYVPSTQRAREELGLRQTVGLNDALRRTIAWHEAAEKTL